MIVYAPDKVRIIVFSIFVAQNKRVFLKTSLKLFEVLFNFAYRIAHVLLALTILFSAFIHQHAFLKWSTRVNEENENDERILINALLSRPASYVSALSVLAPLRSPPSWS